MVPPYGCFVFGFTTCLFAVTAKMISPFAVWMAWQPVQPTASWPPAANADAGNAAATAASARPLRNDMDAPSLRDEWAGRT